MSNLANINDSFTALQEVVLGDVDLQWCDLVPAEHRSKINHVIAKTKEDLDNTAKILESLSIKVHRPKIEYIDKITTPYFAVGGVRMPLSPSDLFLILGTNIIEMASYDQQRYYERLACRSSMLEYFNNGNTFISMPQPLLTNHSYCQDGLTNSEILMEASNVLQVGKDVFVSTAITGNLMGFKWLKQQFPQYDFHQVLGINGHIDCHWAILKPGLVVCNNTSLLHEKFKNWKVINYASEGKKFELIDTNLQDDDWENTNHGITFLVLNEKLILFNSQEKDVHLPLIKELEANQFDICFTNITYSGFFNQGLTCMCLETRRTGQLENYF